MNKNYKEFREEVLNNPKIYPELYRIESMKNSLRFRGELNDTL